MKTLLQIEAMQVAALQDLALVPSMTKPLLLLPSLSSITTFELSRTQKVLVAATCAGLGAVWLVSRSLRRRRSAVRKSALSRRDSVARAARRHKPLTILSPSGETHSLGGAVSPGFHRCVPRQSSVGDHTSVASSGAPPSDTTPQQFGVLGMESLGAALGHFEDALSAYTSQGGPGTLTTQDDAEFVRSLQRVIEDAYVLQDQCEHLFLHQHSVLFRASSPDQSSTYGGARRPLTSASSMESFVSAQGDVADLQDLEDFDESLYPLYMAAVKLHESEGIPFRLARTEAVRCGTDTEYVCKVHCIRLASQLLFSQPDTRTWFVDAGRQIIGDLMVCAGKDPKDALCGYDRLLAFLDSCDWCALEQELRGRGVTAITFYDVVLDFILLDAFEDLDTPPSSVTAVVQNRWLSDGFKESALCTAVWSVLKAKRRLLRQQDGFIAHFYDVTEHLSPVLAWGFLGPDQQLKDTCTFFKEQVLSLLCDMFSFTTARYTCIEELATDLLQMTHERFTLIQEHLALA